jgi:hypothetical protein
MAQIFRQRSNTIARVCLLAAVLLIGGTAWLLHAVYWSPYTTRVNVPQEQPVPFSHKHHVDGLGIDCRYCHASVENAAFAGMPATETCMTCHSQLWTDAPLLAPVRTSLTRNEPLRWTRVYDLPDFVFFNHSIHVHQGISCVTCHGPVDQMPLMRQANTLYMKWCLDCHRDPGQFIGPRDQVFSSSAAINTNANGRKLAVLYHVNTPQLSDCSMCHR